MARKKRILTVEELSKAQHLDKLRTIDAYDHLDKKRTNNPPIGIAKFDRVAEDITTYQFDPNLDPTLEWAGKAEGVSFDVPDTSIHIQESIKPSKILRPVQVIGDDFENPQMSLFGEDPLEKQRRRRDALEFYKHGVDWTNRLIAGDSLVVMNSLLEKEGMAGQVQMCYIDPPYGIKYGSNFQPFVNDMSLKSGDKDEDLTQEPEMITAFRDTWELGIHSYLTYLRNRILLSYNLLKDSGSIFIQISDENVHFVRNICDEIFGPENFVSQISIKKGSVMFAKKLLNSATYYLVWYAKDKNKIKFHSLFKKKDPQDFADTCGSHLWLENIHGQGCKRVPPNKRHNIEAFMKDNKNIKLFGTWSLNAQGNEKQQGYQYNGKTYYPPKGTQWKTSYPNGLNDLKIANRLQEEGDNLRVKLYYEDYPISRLNNLWTGIGAVNDKMYVVQTPNEIPKRCILMTSDPDDLVLDITCGSGTTAYVAEQWGRRWITCDTSRVAIELAKERLMTASFDYYKLAHPDQGISSGFIYKTVPHITLKSIANNEPPAEETLYDQPEIDKTKVRVSGPFTVESLPAPIVKPLEETLSTAEAENMTSKQSQWRSELLATGILGKNGNKLDFSRIEPLEGSVYFQAEGETKEDSPKRAIICFGSETKVMDARFIDMALNEAQNMRPTPGYIIFAAFQFGPEASQMLDEALWPGVTVLKVQMNTDLMTEDLKKKRSSNQSFWLVGQPDVELIKDGRTKNRYKVIVNGFDYYDVKKGTVISGTDSNIAMWMLDTNYDPMNCIEPNQVFFPMGGKKDGWNKLAKTLKAEINQELIGKYAGNESLWFTAEPNTMIAVKIIDDRGIESLRVLKVGEE
ncbi:site-specific DNA-methyltransferase [Acidaminococcus fermentans DSM 20731]|uniref:DNA methylase N-4/N-6 domain protein n=1 Tax=Acidaminococcus fermentans (strain ATCC 25085 / DSM 20731 / CCUG 9996 / CIP 106432 / VR4) TaxID=591001 RepID=D2RK74_ACIFV|nr:site-specific DNA-methyltransferase [Acidaminococcus fermentans]ADB47476.1 DNA methylase N-4/N-6 domain protein [Acidaminococcus fermentans DSM 20731]UEA71911.1 site-specific DNA-methyltransferase [Acidaminococcus fermentans DSM 20731]